MNGERPPKVEGLTPEEVAENQRIKIMDIKPKSNLEAAEAIEQHELPPLHFDIECAFIELWMVNFVRIGRVSVSLVLYDNLVLGWS